MISQKQKWINAFKHMRIPFSVFLMPVYCFALSRLNYIEPFNAVLVFIIIHFLMYPASNGYNSYFDRDEKSIGGLKHPPKVSKELFYLVIVFDILTVVLSLFISVLFAVLVYIYLIISKAYSFPLIRLKKYPVLSTVTVTLFQGAFTFLTIQEGMNIQVLDLFNNSNLLFALVSSVFLLGSYPLTQVYQHEEDSKRGDKTLSLVLGIKGTFIFSAIAMFIGASLLSYLYFINSESRNILLFLLCIIPVLIYFNIWFFRVLKDKNNADFDHTMRMNIISSLCLTAAFLLMIFL